MRRVCYALALGLALVALSAPLQCSAQDERTDKEYTTQQINDISTERFIALLLKPEPGYETFAAMHALGKKAKTADCSSRREILTLVASVMNDRSRPVQQRYQCCYAISDSGDLGWVPSVAYVLNNDPSETMRSVAAEALGRYMKCPASTEALSRAAEVEKCPRVLEVIYRVLGREYTEEQIRSIPAETFLGYLKTEQPGYATFSAMRALAKKAKLSDERNRAAILNMAVSAMNDSSRDERQRWLCCYVISGCGDARWVPSLIEVLYNDPSATMRSVAAEALGQFRANADARAALQEAAKSEKSQKVLDVINQVLGIKPQ